MHSKDKIAIIGVGRWGRNLLKTFAPRTEVALICHAGDPATDEWLKREYPAIPVTHDVNDVMQRTDIVAVCIATPIQTHAFLIRSALESGKDVFVEKPICPDPAEAEALTALAREKNRILMVGYVYLYHEIWEKLKERLLQESAQHILFTWEKYGSFHEDGVWNLAVHEVALANDLLGTPISMDIEPLASVLGIHDVYTFSLKYPGERKVSGIVNRLSPVSQHTITVITPSHTYLWEGNRLLSAEKEKEPTLLWESTSLPLDRECDAFIESLHSRREPLTNGTQASLVTKIIAGAFPQSAQ